MDDAFKEVRDKRGRLLFRYDPHRDLVEVKARRSGERPQIVDLQPYKQAVKSDPGEGA